MSSEEESYSSELDEDAISCARPDLSLPNAELILKSAKQERAIPRTTSKVH